MIKDALDITTMDVKPGNERQAEAANFLEKEFYPFVEKLAKEGEDNGA